MAVRLTNDATRLNVPLLKVVDANRSSLLALCCPMVVSVAVALVSSPTAAAATWSTPVTISASNEAGYAGEIPDVAMDSAGDAAATWISSANSSGTCPCAVRAALRSSHAPFGPPVSLSTSDSANSEVAMDAAGDAVLVWNTLGDLAIGTPSGEHVFASIRPAGGSFGPPTELSAPARGGANPAVSMDSGGDAVVAFTSGSGGASTDVEASFRPAGGSFGPPTVVTGSGDNVPNCCDHGNLAMSANGRTIVAYNRCTAASLCNSGTPTTGNEEIDAATALPGAGRFGGAFAVSPASSITSSGVTYPVFSESSVALDDSGDAAVGMSHDLSISTSQTDVTSSDAGGPFPTTPTELDASGRAPEVAINASRETVAQWQTASGGLDTAVRPSAVTFGASAPLDTLSYGSALATAANLEFAGGSVLSAWLGPNGAGGSGDETVDAAFRTPGGSFGSPLTVTPSTRGATLAPGSPIAAALNQTGGGLIVWLTGLNTVQASFSGSALSATQTLTVSRTGRGSGVVKSADGAISCGSSCVHAYPLGSVVTLSASPASGSTFTGWSGACRGTRSCSVTVSTAQSVTASFVRTPKPSVKIRHHPAKKLTTTKTVRVSFVFATTGATSSFKCKLDKRKFARCKSPIHYRVGRGKHTFAVEALGPGGTSKTATFRFTVVRATPKRHP